MNDTIDTFEDESTDVDRLLWVALVATFVVGDAVTTVYGLRLAGVYESHPVSATVLSASGFVGIIAAKVVVFGIAFGMYRHADDRYKTAIPLSLTVVGSVIVGVNTAVIVFALL